MVKVFGNLKQIVNLARGIQVFGTDMEQLVIGSFTFYPFLRKSFSNLSFCRREQKARPVW